MRHGHVPRAVVSVPRAVVSVMDMDTVNQCPTRVNCFDSPNTVKLSLGTARTCFGQSFVPIYFVSILLHVKQFNFKK